METPQDSLRWSNGVNVFLQDTVSVRAICGQPLRSGYLICAGHIPIHWVASTIIFAEESSAEPYPNMVARLRDYEASFFFWG